MVYAEYQKFLDYNELTIANIQHINLMKDKMHFSSGTTLKSKGMHACNFSEKGQKKSKILENLGKNVQNLKTF